MIQNHQIEQTDCKDIFKVKSDNDTYRVDIGNPPHCECKDFYFNGHKKREEGKIYKCKHILQCSGIKEKRN